MGIVIGRKRIDRIAQLVLTFSIYMLLSTAYSAPLAPEEVEQIEQELGIMLTQTQLDDLAAIVKPDVPDAFHAAAAARIERFRKADLELEILDELGQPLKGAEVQLKLRQKKFRFGGVMGVRKMAGAEAMGISAEQYRSRFLKFFDAAGLGNGLKPKLRRNNEPHLPFFFDWCAANGLEARGHTLIWPGPGNNQINNHLPHHIQDILDSVVTRFLKCCNAYGIN